MLSWTSSKAAFCSACHSKSCFCHITQGLGSPETEEQVEHSAIDETVLIVPSPRDFIQTSDDIDSESVLPLTTLTGNSDQSEFDLSAVLKVHSFMGGK